MYNFTSCTLFMFCPYSAYYSKPQLLNVLWLFNRKQYWSNRMKKKNRQNNHIQLLLSTSQCFCPEYKGHRVDHSSGFEPGQETQETQEIPNRFFSMTKNPCPDLMLGMYITFPGVHFIHPSWNQTNNTTFRGVNVHFYRMFLYLLPINTLFVGW